MRMTDIINGCKSISANKLRSTITISLISMGICAMVAIKSSIATIEEHLLETYREMGNGITHITGNKNRPITHSQVRRFLEEYRQNGNVTIFCTNSYTITAKSAEKSTPPLCQLCATNEHYLRINNYRLDKGRNFTPKEIRYGANCCIIGNTIVKRLFGKENPLGGKIEVTGKHLEVIGILENGEGSSKGSIENHILIPWNNPLACTTLEGEGFVIYIENENNYAEPTFRRVRKLSFSDKKDYTIGRSEQIIDELQENMSIVEKGGAIISIVTLIGAAMGLMNIMLIQVGEKQREFGIRKSVGARKRDILNQVLTESLILSIAGSISGIILGIATSVAITQYLECPLYISFKAIFGAITVCLIVGLCSGYYPAIKGANNTIVDSLKAR